MLEAEKLLFGGREGFEVFLCRAIGGMQVMHAHHEVDRDIELIGKIGSIALGKDLSGNPARAGFQALDVLGSVFRGECGQLEKQGEVLLAVPAAVEVPGPFSDDKDFPHGVRAALVWIRRNTLQFGQSLDVADSLRELEQALINDLFRFTGSHLPNADIGVELLRDPCRHPDTDACTIGVAHEVDFFLAEPFPEIVDEVIGILDEGPEL